RYRLCRPRSARCATPGGTASRRKRAVASRGGSHMRDPGLVVRAQQAATELESAWCHWRSMHGLSADPRQAVSSYVGYSLDAPWGESRIVFSISAEGAERLAHL